MPILHLTTLIHAPVDLVFDLARCIDLHETSMTTHGETAVGGLTSGLITLGQTVTWRAKHFGIWQRLTAQITIYDPPHHFRYTMVAGAFKRFDHDHYFQPQGSQTCMIDVFDYTSPLGLLGFIADALVLKRYMERLLAARNQVIKTVAESSQWQTFLPVQDSYMLPETPS